MSAFQMELDAAVHLVHEALADIDQLLRQVGAEDGYELEDVELANALICRTILGDGSLALIQERLTNLIAERLGTYESVVEGVGVVRRHRKKDGPPKVMDDDGLWRAVLDTRLVDALTGEVIPQHEIIKRAYGSKSKETGCVRLTGASKSKVKVLGLDPDMFFDEPAPRPGWDLEVL